jgi:hypothetical protein
MARKAFKANAANRQKNSWRNGVAAAKTYNMSVADWFNRFYDIKRKFELALGPNSLGLDDNDDVDIALRNHPNKWVKDLLRAGNDPANETMETLRFKLEQLEAAESITMGVLGNLRPEKRAEMIPRGRRQPRFAKYRPFRGENHSEATRRGVRDQVRDSVGTSQRQMPRQNGRRDFSWGRRNNYNRGVRSEAHHASRPNDAGKNQRSYYQNQVWRVNDNAAGRAQREAGQAQNIFSRNREANLIEKSLSDSDIGF